jgi:glycosyltransferase involved in cell wall biosynthesis
MAEQQKDVLKLIFLSKRRPQGKDLIERPYGRFFYLPRYLAERGHEVFCHLLSYRKEATFKYYHDRIHWQSHSIFDRGGWGFLKSCQRCIRTVRPDWIVGFSDTYYGILAQFLASRSGSRACIDVYDNFESYIPWARPLHAVWRRAIARADLTTVAGPQLGSLFRRYGGPRSATVVPMAADPDYRPLSSGISRKQLGLPLDRRIVGYCGAIHPNRGIRTLFEAAERLHRHNPDILFVISGRKAKGVTLPARVKWLGYLPDHKMPALINSLDVLWVVNQPSPFGNFSYPVKLYEAMACQVPVVASATAPVRWILKDQAPFLVRPNDPQALVTKTIELISRERFDYGCMAGWKASGEIMEAALLACGTAGIANPRHN